MIRVPQVRVIDEDGGQLGVMPTYEALRLAQERGFDLVEVAPLASPPVTKLLDFGQYKYDLTKREKEAKRRQRSVEFKEIRLRPKIGVGDFDTKVNRAIEFLEDGDRIKVSVQFRGRELTHPEIGRNLLQKFTEQIKDHGTVERAPLLEGKSMHLTVASTHKPKGEGSAAPAPAQQGAPAPQAAPAPAPEAVPAASTPAPAPEPEAAPQPVAADAPAAPAIEEAPAPTGATVEAVVEAAPAEPKAPKAARAPKAAAKTEAAPDGEAAPAKPRAARAKPAAPATESGDATETGPAAAPAAPKRRTAAKKEASAEDSAASRE